jgi:alkylresorcinol/alkylpyrone synthase
MLQRTSNERPEFRGPNGPGVDILSIATATPAHKVSQAEALHRAKQVFPLLGRLEGLYTNTGIETRYSCVPPDWCHEPHGWEARTEIFQKHAVDLLEIVARKAIADAGLEFADIDAVVANTITGLAVPSLDVLLINRIGLNQTVRRLPIFGFGCGGGVAGLSRAAEMAVSRPGSNVLFVTVELCSLCVRPNDPSLAMFVSAALFGDGAAAVVLRAPALAQPAGKGACARILSTGETCWHDTGHLLGWDIKDDGFGMVLSPELPALLRGNLAPALAGFLAESGWDIDDMDGVLMHPGGRKILEVAGETLGLSRQDLRHSWEILRQFGNLSSAAILFVMQAAMDAGARGRHVMAAFGPGFSAYFAVAELVAAPSRRRAESAASSSTIL